MNPRSLWWCKAVALAFGVLLIAFSCWHWHHLPIAEIHSLTDQGLTYGLYAIGTGLTGLGVFVSIKPPHKALWHSASALLFALLAISGFLILREQTSRTARTAEIEAARDSASDQNIRDFKFELDGVYKSIKSVAEGSGDARWKSIISQIQTLKTSSVPIVEVQGSSAGNLKARAIDLSSRIFQDLYAHGWFIPNYNPHIPIIQKYPEIESEDQNRWIATRSENFRFRFLNEADEIRAEFATLHLKDQDLDETIVRIREEEKYPIRPGDMELIARGILSLSDQLKAQ